VKKSTAVTNIVSALDARTQLGQILRRVKNNGERFVIDRRGPMLYRSEILRRRWRRIVLFS